MRVYYFILMYLILFPQKDKIDGLDISKTKREFLWHTTYKPELNIEDFLEAAAVYPDYLKIEETGVRLYNKSKLKKILINRTKYSKSDSLEKIITKCLKS